MENVREKIMKYVFLLCACVSTIAVVLICVFIFAGGSPALGKIGIINFLTGTKWRPSQNSYGIFPMIVASLYTTAGAIIFGVPLGVLCAVFLSCFCPDYLYRILKPAVELLSGIPSIVYGFFGLTAVVPLIQKLSDSNGKGLLSTSILLAIMILPTITAVSLTSIKSVEKSYYEGSRALGATHEESVFKVTLPAAKSGVLAGIVLGIGRAIGETMAVVMIAGNSPVIPNSLNQTVRTLTSNIVLEMAYATGLHREALIATAAVLFVFILIINLSLSAIKRSQKK